MVATAVVVAKEMLETLVHLRTCLSDHQKLMLVFVVVVAAGPVVLSQRLMTVATDVGTSQKLIVEELADPMKT